MYIQDLNLLVVKKVKRRRKAFSQRYLALSKMIKLGDLVKESHTISFTKDEMELLHRDGQLKKDGHLYVYDESLEER